METADLIGLMVPVTYLAMLAAESLWPARQFPRVRGWRVLGFAFLVMMATLSTIVPLLIPAEWLEQHRLLDGTGLGVVGGAIVGYIVYSAVAYAWHRSTHTLPGLWRLFHQLHHSAQRVDMGGAAMFHPFDIAAYVILSVLTATFVLGLDPLAAALTGYIAAFYSFFQHMNIRTPWWIGYLIQRPEAHCIHHQRDVHAFNYGDLPVWDILLGTFRNPRTYQGAVGFDDGAARRYGAMLAFADVNQPQLGKGSMGIKTAASRAG